jgi:hypothetical protein
MEAGMKPLRIVLGLVAMMLFCSGIIAIYDSNMALADRVGPGWFQSISMYSGTTLLLVAIVISIADIQVGTRRYEAVGPRGLRLGRTTFLVGALSLAIGLVLPVLFFLRLLPPILILPLSLTFSFSLPPILLAVGLVLLRSSAAALRRSIPHPPRVLSVGEATLRMGFVLLLEAWFLPAALRGLDQGLGMFGTFIWMESFPAGLVLLVLGAMIQAIEVGNRSIRAVLGLAAVLLACAGTVVFAFQLPSGRFAPGWIRTVAGYGEMTLLAVGVVTSIVSAQAGAGGYAAAGPRGMHLWRNSLRVGALLLGVGILVPVFMSLRVVPLPLYDICRSMPPILIAVGAVLLRGSIVSSRRVGGDPPRVLTLGAATLRIGLVLLLLGCSSPASYSGVPLLPRSLVWILRMDCIPTGLALLVLGALIKAAEQSPHVEVREAPGNSQKGHEPHVRIGSRPMVREPEAARPDRLPPLDLGPRSNG